MLFRYLFLENKHRRMLCLPTEDIYRSKIRWLKLVSKRSQCLGCAHTCMMGMLAVLLPLPCFSSSCFSSAAVACLTGGYELYCLLSGLVPGPCLSLTEVPQGWGSRSSWSAGSSRARPTSIRVSLVHPQLCSFVRLILCCTNGFLFWCRREGKNILWVASLTENF